MHSTQIICFILVVGCYASVRGYAMGGFGAGAGAGAAAAAAMFAPRPYGFAYQAPDEMGNAHFRKEQGDGSGGVQGSYGYTDNQGLFRQVDYVANAGGFHANVRTNEPGTDDELYPADVTVMAQKPPAGVIQKYAFGGGFGGIGAGGAGMMRSGGGGGLFAGMPGGFAAKGF